MTDDAEPLSLTQVVEDAGLASVPTDPFSGDPLKLIKLDGVWSIYSVGPDGDDDEAEIALELSNYDSGQDGDFVFRLDRRNRPSP